jgi:hypothetical protein
MNMRSDWQKVRKKSEKTLRKLNSGEPWERVTIKSGDNL